MRPHTLEGLEMLDLRCPFSPVLLLKDYQCEFAEEVVRRGGGEIACQNTKLNSKCAQLADQLRESILPMMGQENNLLTVPQAIIVKVLFGSVSALKKMAEDLQHESLDSLSNITLLTLDAYPDLAELPYAHLLETVEKTQIKKRRNKNKK